MISILLPTRNRPQNIIRFVDSIVNTVSDIHKVELLIYIDDDDETSIPALNVVAEKVSTNAVQGNRIPGSHRYNELVKMATGDIIMYAADDIIFRTPNWNGIVEREFDKYEDKILLVYGEDGFQHGRIGTHGFIHRFWIELLGYVLPPKLASAYADEWVSELAERVGRRCYMPDLITEHIHPATGKAQFDDTYTKGIELSGNVAEYYKFLEPDRIKDAQTLKSFMEIFTKNV